ncbi:hypothetical protein [Streptomyces sp. NRRL S-1824]|uniref:hypothetical protein n=1 Tax=Streptomyces sp. NRRL S-1824 TaxID=1463889 RepID=UPI00131EA804|nr:hypothetical protein [Streptomyces sp. NRRL S-1824]
MRSSTGTRSRAADLAAPTVAADLLPGEVSVHAALLSALAHLAQAVAAEAGASGDLGDSRCATSQVPDDLGGT